MKKDAAQRYFDIPTDPAFQRWFYKQRLSSLVQTLELQQSLKRPKYALRLKDVARLLTDFVERAEDGTRCNAECKNMYFCDRKKGHKGRHAEGKGLIWD